MTFKELHKYCETLKKGKIMRFMFPLSIALSFFFGFIIPSSAATVTQNLSVAATVASSCSISSFPTLNFGTITNPTAVTNASTTIGVLCTNSTTYNIGLSAGAGTGATVTTRIMNGPSSATLNYSLYQDSGHTTVWGTTIGTNTVAATGSGVTQTYTMYGQIFAPQTPIPGAYTDTVVATITY